ncbi:DUF4848 domain-containing protein [Flavobacterium branchiophilum]|nr:hypothetical protein [Flavobacterium branchiophilum]CCB70174.1 Putative lipoprotein precursor [Flavobacterium branchiophilum FL-15]
MKNFKIITFISFLLILFSCEKEENIKIQNTNIDNVSIKDGRLSFQSIESLQRVYKEYADATDEKLASYLQPLYKKGFYSLRPIVTESNENFLYYHYTKNDSTMRKSNHRSQEDVFDYLDDLEDIIGDDTFSAFLNNNAEILVADKIYKYTDVGLFISNEDKYNNLLSYLDEKNVSQNIIEETPLNIKTNLFNEFPSDGINTINPDIKYFKVAPMDPDTDGGGSGAPYTPTPGSPASTDPSYNAFLNNLGSCQIQHGLFTTWFGENDVCIDKYESRRRVKTKAFNYNYLIVYHMGVKCVHQYRGWTGFWRLEATDEIRLVVEAAQFEYDLDALLGNNAINN